MAAAQICVREKGSDICPFYPGNKVVHECEDCRTLVCSSCVTSLNHKKHSFRDIKLAVDEKVDNINSYIQNKKQQTLPDLIQQLNDTTDKLQYNNQEYEDVITKAKKQSVRLIAEIEEHIAKTVSRLEFLQEKKKRILERHRTIIKKLQSQLEKRIKECELCIRSYTDIEVYDSELPRDHPVVIPNHQSLISSTFTPCTDTEEYLAEAFGDILISRPQNIPPGQSASKKSTKIVTQYKLMEEPIPLHVMDTSHKISVNSICLTPDNMAWTRRAADNKLYLVDDKGAEHRTLELVVDFGMMCVDPTTGELYCCCPKDTSIRRISTDTGKTTVMFYTLSGDIPCDIDCLDDDRMVVSTVDEDYEEEGDMNKLGLCSYTITGNLMYSYTYYGRGPFLSVCPQTDNIALMSGEQVTVLNDTLHEVYTYQGEEGLDDQFMCVTAVVVGEHLLVGDCGNKIIHILTTATGKWIKSITTDSMSGVAALGVQQNGVQWDGCLEPDKLLHMKCLE